MHQKHIIGRDGGILGFDVVKEIINVEKEGACLVEKARNEALVLQMKTTKETERIICEAESKAREAYDRVIAGYEEKAKEEEEKILKENQLLKSRILDIPSERWDKAVNLVIERIVSGVGNS